MYLKSLELNGFKSFARKSELEFSTSITSIVGPNGSGKSNIAEAFRFVLGEQSLKSMRGKRGEDLIFNGSTSLARGNRASVKITLDNTGKQFPVDFDEVTIERVVYRDGVNEYLLNGGRSRLKDIQELLASANVGSTGHHIISQGEADRILTANPKERREMIEDALGLKVFQYKKAESERKLEKTKENIAQVESLRREVAPHLKFLERQVKKIEKSLEVKEELRAAYGEYLKREDTYLTFREGTLRDAARAPKEELARLKEELAHARQVLAEAEKDVKRDALVCVEGKLRTARERRHELAREVARLEGQLEYLKRRIEAHVARAGEDARPAIPFSRVERAILSAEDLAQNVAADAGALQRTLAQVIGVLRGLLNDVAREGGDSTLEHDREEAAELEKTAERTKQELEVSAQEERELQEAYESVRASIEAERQEGRDAERDMFRIMSREQELERTLADLRRDEELLERDRSEFKRELQEAVALLGRGASEYLSIECADGPDAIASEARSVQLERRRMLEKMKIRLEELGGGASEDIMKEYGEVKERDEFLEREIADLEKSVESLEALIRELGDELNSRFQGGIDKIAVEFERFFTLMFGGGKAKLLRVAPKRPKKAKESDGLFEGAGEGEEGEPEGPQEEGIDIDVSLPNKRVRGLEMLSGGERALTSIALIFAMSQVNPPPFVILDETDAALDEANSKRYGDMIESLAQHSQLILITHNRETMSRAGVLYGITMGGDGISKLLSVKLEEALEVAK